MVLDHHLQPGGVELLTLSAHEVLHVTRILHTHICHAFHPGRNIDSPVLQPRRHSFDLRALSGFDPFSQIGNLGAALVYGHLGHDNRLLVVWDHAGRKLDVGVVELFGGLLLLRVAGLGWLG